MNRREFSGRLAMALAGIPVIRNDEASGQALAGVGILYYPQQVYADEAGRESSAAQIASTIAAQIQRGSILVLPSNRDSDGYLLWDFRIQGGDPKQVKVERR
jgi:hypothetical protein